MVAGVSLLLAHFSEVNVRFYLEEQRKQERLIDSASASLRRKQLIKWCSSHKGNKSLGGEVPNFCVANLVILSFHCDFTELDVLTQAATDRKQGNVNISGNRSYLMIFQRPSQSCSWYLRRRHKVRNYGNPPQISMTA